MAKAKSTHPLVDILHYDPPPLHIGYKHIEDIFKSYRIVLYSELS